MKIALASVAKGFTRKEAVRRHLSGKAGVEVLDLGPASADVFVRYDDYARLGARAVREKSADRAILICGTGMGMAIAANKYAGIRAACCESVQAARMSRIVNDSNILAFGEDLVPEALALDMVDVWLATKFQDAPQTPEPIRAFWKSAVDGLDSLGAGGAFDRIAEPTPARAEELNRLLAMPPETVEREAGKSLRVFGNVERLHEALAEFMAEELARDNAAKRPTTWILPVGPFGQYPHFARLVRERGLSLKNAHFFFMDEYRGPDGRAFPAEHPLSFKGVARETLLKHLPADLAPSPERVVFPDETNIDSLARRIAEAGGIGVCFGGVGIHGHLAFNEPAIGVSFSGPRRVRLNDYTTTINAVRAEVGGNLEAFPREAYTLGMRQILAARRIVLACRNGGPLDWANAALRLALFGTPGDDYPVTHIRGKDVLVLTDKDTLACPKYRLTEMGR